MTALVRPAPVGDGGPAVHVEMLGHFRVIVDSRPLVLTQSCERLVAILAVEDRARTREHLADALWPDSNQARAGGNLRRALCLVRRAAPGIVDSVGNRLSVAARVTVDLHRQRQLVDEITGGERVTAHAQELHLLRGDLLPDWDEPWLVAAREEARQLRLLSLEAIAAAYLGDSRPGTALAVALGAARDEPLRESAQWLVVQAHLAQGNRADAARHYTFYRTFLWNELRLRPGASMATVMEPLLRDAALAR